MWSGLSANDEAFRAYVSNPPVQDDVHKQAEHGDGFSIEVYGTVGEECRRLMEYFRDPLKVFTMQLDCGRVA